MMGAFFAATTCTHSFFFLPNWWQYLPNQPSPPDCNVTFHFPQDVWAVALSVLDMLLRIGGFVAVISIIIAGVQYVTAMGETEKGVSARKRLTSSLIGLIIVLIASGVVAFIGNTVKG